LALFAISFLALGYLGLQPAEGTYVIAARVDPVTAVPERLTIKVKL